MQFAPTPSSQIVEKREPCAFFFRVTHPYDTSLHGSDDDTFVYIIKSAYSFVKTKEENSSFPVPTFYKNGSDILPERRVLNNKHLAAETRSVDKFMQIEIDMPKISISFVAYHGLQPPS